MTMQPDSSRPGVRKAAGPYVRPMAGWWQHNPFFVRYMVRELTAVAVWVYALILTVGVFRLGQGEAAWNRWLQALQSPLSIALHLVLLLGMVLHVHSWFEIMPKTMAPIVLGGTRVSAQRIQRTGWSVAAAVFVAALLLAVWSQT
jgi:fumarate reductase subunit C